MCFTSKPCARRSYQKHHMQRLVLPITYGKTDRVEGIFSSTICEFRAGSWTNAIWTILVSSQKHKTNKVNVHGAFSGRQSIRPTTSLHALNVLLFRGQFMHINPETWPPIYHQENAHRQIAEAEWHRSILVQRKVLSNKSSWTWGDALGCHDPLINQGEDGKYRIHTVRLTNPLAPRLYVNLCLLLSLSTTVHCTMTTWAICNKSFINYDVPQLTGPSWRISYILPCGSMVKFGGWSERRWCCRSLTSPLIFDTVHTLRGQFPQSHPPRCHSAWMI